MLWFCFFIVLYILMIVSIPVLVGTFIMGIALTVMAFIENHKRRKIELKVQISGILFGISMSIISALLFIAIIKFLQ